MELLLAFALPFLWTQYVWPAAVFVIVLSLVVFVHELGHFLVAKWSGIKVEEFAFGMGPKIGGVRWGETVYRLNLLPLGGYVHMLGQDDFNPSTTAEDQERSWQRARPRNKILVLLAGVTMNVIFAAVVFVIVYMVGIRLSAPIVGDVRPGFPAATAALPPEIAKAMGVANAHGLQGGDRILKIDGKPIRKFQQVIMNAALSRNGQEYEFEIARTISGKEYVFPVRFGAKTLDKDMEGIKQAFGIEPGFSSMIEEPGKHGYVGEQKFLPGDRILEIAGMPVAGSWDVETALARQPGKPAAVVVDRNGARVTVTVQPAVQNEEGDHKNKAANRLLTMLGMESLIRVEAVSPGTSAEKAGLEAGDVVVRYGSLDYPSYQQLADINKDSIGREIPIDVLRSGKVVSAKVTPIDQGGKGLIGIVVKPDIQSTVLAAVAPDSPAAKAGVVKGAAIVKVNDTAVANWGDLYAALRDNADKDVSLTWKIDGKEHAASLGKLTAEQFNSDDYRVYSPAVGFLAELRLPQRAGPVQAILWSIDDTRENITDSLRTMESLIFGRVSTKGISGPVGIAQATMTIARKGVIESAYFMAIISAMVAVFNLLPLPVLDGGQLLIVVIEKIRGQPLSKKAFTGIMIGGWVVVLGIFVSVTLNDIMRLFRH